MTTKPKRGDRAAWVEPHRPRRAGRVTAIKPRPQARWEHTQPVLMYHILGDDGIPYVVPERYVERDVPQKVVVSFNPLDVKRCAHCSAYLQSGLQDTVHPHHQPSCELYPDNAWRGYVLVKLSECNHKIGYHSDPHQGCLEHYAKEG